MPALLALQPLALQSAYSDLKQRALEQERLLVGTPGSVGERTVDGKRFYYRQFYDAAGKKGAEYLGPVDDAAGERAAAAARQAIADANALLEAARLLARAGYARVDARTDAILAALATNGMFRAGATLVGSHAYGALLNELGVRAAPYATEDIDVARDRALVREREGEGERRSFAEMLADSRLELFAVPQLQRGKPSTSFKLAGGEKLRVDLLVPTAGREVKVLEARDLGAHATALPHLRYLLDGPIDAIVLGRAAVVPVRVPRPERLAWHKLLVSELRNATSDKKRNDVEQAAVLVASLVEREPGALEDAFEALSAPEKKLVRAAAPRVLRRLEDAGAARAAETARAITR